MKVSLHNGRNGSAKHNDRSFMQAKPKGNIEHINPNKTQDNVIWINPISKKKSFIDAELDIYNRLFSDALKSTNQKYLKQGHKERVKTMSDWLNSPKTRPEETILQIGDMYSDISPKTFTLAVNSYVNALIRFSRNNGNPFTLLNVAIHFDEASPHAHIRKVYHYKDPDGNLRLGQNQALKQAGIELPNPNKAESRTNNRKIEFDSMCRGEWQEIVQSFGYEINKKPRTSIRHKNKADYINDQLAKQEAQIKLNRQAIQKNAPDSTGLAYKIAERTNTIMVKLDYLKALESNSERLKTIEKELQTIKNNPNKLKVKAREEAQEIERKAHSQANKIIKKAKEEANQILDEANYDRAELRELQYYYNHNERLKRRYPRDFERIEAQYQEFRKSIIKNHDEYER